ncbi:MULTISPECIES: ABC transporter ATP-binding protein [Pseudonocardia]|uniref:Glutathione import ATP-binding protein GsiA n=2 Tax=Pseudonocardia TaxID=1847 RepID=A0A1Y2MGT4_PSEAH|nr:MULTISPECIES: dipeptide/oligopeptide/nickel ABC transporter ATP-binding protein [Pseudonocardia]OSY34470.1 Glutathione import ATP-binding protein GsiA [Pseudonocardia autotrophica]TDN72643.1 ABC-type dipeptide/oligopeptide/nickel transport system ATPase subunit [Pseudonocardia autotrophica]BBG03355.1 hypothetical protein Pdca_45640 [Pseudonocardia autotrophica]GEC29718.1 hypothetical protein PSA01_67470 [Pseudonocardia saturnea]
MADGAADPTPVLTLEAVDVSVGTGRGRRRVLHEVDLDLRAGEVLGVVGRSGSGKSTLGRVCVGLQGTENGHARLASGDDLVPMGRRVLRAARPTLQMVFQDPYSTFPSFRTVGRTIDLNARRLLPGADRHARRAAALDAFGEVGLVEDHLDRRPAELSGGQLQRAAIARALLARPRVLVADEVVSALDLTTQAAIVSLLGEVSSARSMAVLFISHDLGVVASSCERIAVLDDGRIVEHGATRSVIAARRAPATRALFDAVPRLPGNPEA